MRRSELYGKFGCADDLLCGLQKDLTQRVAEIRVLEERQKASRLRQGNFFQSMRHRAFNGEL